MLSRIKPKHVMIFGILAMLIGLGFFALWEVADIPYSIRKISIIKWARRSLGRYGISSIYFFGGLVVFLKGYAAMRSEERSANIQQQQGNWPGNNR